MIQKLRKLILLVIILMGGFVSWSQGKITLQVLNEQQSPMENATIELLRAEDSILVKSAISDTKGQAELDNLKFGNYLLRVSMVHYRTNYSSIVPLNGEQSSYAVKIILVAGTPELAGVTVTARKPFIQKLSDRLVVNVENSIVSAGSSAMDVLERSPGVRVGQNDAISLAGKSGVIIMINGKLVPMSGEELGNYLRSLPASVLERIDLITNPSAKYDAAGNAGIIDLRLKKDQRHGFNGTVTANYGQGRLPKAGAGTTMNYRNSKINVFSSVNRNYSKNFNNLVTRRDFFHNGNYTGAYDQDNMIMRPSNSTVGRIGLDFFASKKTIIGFIATASNYLTNRTGENNSAVLDINNQTISSFLTTAKGNEDFRNYVFNFNLKHSFDSIGRELTVDADLAGYYRDWASDFFTGYYDINAMPLQPPYIAKTDQDGFTGIKTIKMDYVHPLSSKSKMEAGAKTSVVTTENDVLFYDMSNGSAFLDSSRSNSFIYDENINAGYLNFSTEWKKFSIQAGLRAEQTNIKTLQVFDKLRLDSSYLQFFPSVFLNYKFKEDNTVGVSVSRRIDRPGYGQLNPFKIFVDPSFYATGDPTLKPAITWSYELNYIRKQVNMTLAYSRTNQYITTVLIPSETQDRVTVQTPANLRSFDYVGFVINSPLRISKWWNVISNANFFYGHYKGFLAETRVDGKGMNMNISANNSFTAKKGWGGELNLSFSSGSNLGVMVVRANWGLSAGIQKTLWKNKATLRLNATDILWRQWPRFSSRYTNYHEVSKAMRDTRVINLSFTYRFGKTTVAQARRRTTASEEERRRAG